MDGARRYSPAPPQQSSRPAPSASSASNGSQSQLGPLLGPLLFTPGFAQEDVLKDMAWLQATAEDDTEFNQHVWETLNRIRGMSVTARFKEQLAKALNANGPLLGHMFGGAVGTLLALIGISTIAAAVASGLVAAVAAVYIAHTCWRCSQSHVVYVCKQLSDLLERTQREAMQVGSRVSAEMWGQVLRDRMLVTVYDPFHKYATIHMLLKDERGTDQTGPRGRYELRLLAILEMVLPGTEADMLKVMHDLDAQPFFFKKLQTPTGDFETLVAHCQGSGCGQFYPIQTRQPGQAPGLMRRTFSSSKTPRMRLYPAKPEEQGAPEMVKVVETLVEEDKERRQRPGAAHDVFSPPLTMQGGCWVLPHNLVLDNRGIPGYFQKYKCRDPPRLIRTSVVDMLGIAAAMEHSYGRLQFRMSYAFTNEQQTFGHVAVARNSVVHKSREMSKDGREHIRVIARPGILTTGRVVWGTESSFNFRQQAGKGVNWFTRGYAQKVGNAFLDGWAHWGAERQRSGSGPLPVPSLDPAYHGETQQITRLLQGTHIGFIQQFCDVAERDTDHVFDLIVNVVITHHHFVTCSPSSSKALRGVEVTLDGPATRFLAVAGGVLYVCKPATSADSSSDTFLAPPADDYHALNPEGYFTRILQAYPRYDTDIAFKQYFEKTPWASTLARDPNLTLDPALHANVENVWADYRKHHELRMEEVRGVEPDMT